MNTTLRDIKNAYKQSGDTRIYRVANNSIGTIAKQLNEKDNHFILELIQNADDNPYNKSSIPSLKLIYTTFEIDNSIRNVVLICNNEIGFKNDNVEAICSVDESTKKLDEDSTGEKGIGFKSVFRITDCPYIFSNEFNFKLPEYEDIGDDEKYVKYITPHEVFNIPEKIQELRKFYTTVIALPIDESKSSARRVKDMLLDIDAKTILFLRKLRKIDLDIEENGKLISQRSIEREDSNAFNSKINHKTTHLKATLNGKNTENTKFFIYRKLVEKPANINHEKRLNAKTRDIQIGISLDSNYESGVFAFLPVYKRTGLPFLIQSDFLLTADRRSILVDLEWNEWLRDQIAQSYVEAISSLIKSKISIEEKLKLYYSIPTETSNEFLEPVVDNILEKLQREKIIYTFETEKFLEPTKVKIADRNILALLKESTDKPKSVSNNSEPLLNELVNYNDLKTTLEKLKITKLSIAETLKLYFEDTVWMEKNSVPWFIKLYEFLRNSRDVKIHHLKIIKVKDSTSLKSTESSNIYFKIENDINISKFIGDDYTALKIDEIDPELLKRYLKSEKDEKKNWLTEKLKIRNFSTSNLASDLVDNLNKCAIALKGEEIIKRTELIFELDPEQLKSKKVSLVLNNREIVHYYSKIEIAVPENYEEFGWKNFFVSENDREHFKILSSDYRHEIIDALLDGNINLMRFPKFKENQISYYRNPHTPSGLRLKKELTFISAERWREDITGSEILLPDHFTNSKKENFSISILNFIKYLYKDSHSDQFRYSNLDYLVKIGIKIKGRAENRGYTYRYLDSEFHHFITSIPWLYTNDVFGFQVPSSVSLDKPEIREIFGDSVPYISNITSNEVLKLLGVQTSITKESLINYLEQLKESSNSDIEVIKAIYQQLDIRLKNSPFSENKVPKDIIFIPEIGWKSHDECVWENTEGMDDAKLISIGQIYPELESFFVSKLFVPKKLSLDYYISRWQILQKENSLTKKQVSRVYRALKEHIESQEDAVDFMLENELYLFQGNLTTNQYFDFEDLIFADDNKLNEIFEGHENLVFFPKEDGFAVWQNFFDNLRVSRLTQKVTISICEAENTPSREQTKFLTNASILLMAAFLKTKTKIYSNFLEYGIFEKLLKVKEILVEEDEITLEYELEFETETGYSICYFENSIDTMRLFVCNNTERHHVAQEIFRVLKNIDDELPNPFKDKIENYLESKSTQRIEDEGLKDPIEVEEIIEKIIDETVEPEDEIDEPQEPEKGGEIDDEDDKGIEEPLVNINVDRDQSNNVKTNKTEDPAPSPYQPTVKQTLPDDEPEEPILLPITKPIYAEPKVEDIEEVDEQIGTKTKSEEEKALLEQKRLQNEIEKLNSELKNSRYKELGSKKTKTLERFSFGWLKELTKLECLLEQNNNSSQSYFYTFSTIRFENDVVYLGSSDRLVSNNIEELENLKLEVYGVEKKATITLKSVSVNGYHVRAKLAKLEDKNVIDFSTIQKARIQVENRSFIWSSVQALLETLNYQNDINLEECATREGIKYIYGPPGTGKTRNIIEHQLSGDKSTMKSKILILAPTNKAADVITERLIDSKPSFNYFRFGNTNSEKIEKHKCFVGTDFEQREKSFTLITTTARYFYAQLWEDQMIMNYEWDKIIIDEASMINLAQMFGVIFKTHEKTKIIMAGDPHQIQPIVSAENWQNISIFDVIGLTDFSAENRQKWKNQVTFLTNQYRSARSIGDLYGKFCYSGFVDTKAEIGKSYYMLCNNIKMNRLNFVTYPILQNSHLYQPKYLNNSSYHLYLALMINEWISVFTQQFENKPKTIGIISPYRAQSDLLQKMIHSGSTSHHGCQIIVSTVHSFQGDECDIIVCAFNPPNKGHENNAINNKNIINVAISRAKENLILFMPDNFEKYPNLNELKTIFDKSISPKTDITAAELEMALFGEVDKIEQITYSTAHHPINVFGNSQYRYEIKVEDDALDIQVNVISE